METLQPQESPKGECENLGMGGGVRGQSQSVEGTLGGTVPRDEREPGALLGESQVGSVGERGGGGGEGHGERRDHVVRPRRPWKPWQGDEAKTLKRLPPPGMAAQILVQERQPITLVPCPLPCRSHFRSLSRS